MENLIIDPQPPSLEGLKWRPVTRDDLADVVDLADECWRADGGLAFLNIPENLSGRYFPDAPGAGIGAFTDAGLVACATVHNNPGAERAYVRLGFETVGRRARYERVAER